MSLVRILIADDHAIVRRGLRSLLEAHAGWEVCGEAATGSEAVKMAEKLKPDVVVLDIVMPELNGLDVARQILKLAPQSEVLVLTMHHSEEMAHEILRAGARGYVLKSDADAELVAAVDALREHKPFLSSKVTDMVLAEYVEGWANSPNEMPRRLTNREREIVQLLAAGKSNKEVAYDLGISVKTVDTHRANIMLKLGLKSLSDIVHYAIRNKMVEP